MRYFLLHKPFNMESQFIRNYPGRLLGDLGFDFPEGTHALGRLDKHSEGLLLLTTNKAITKLLFQGSRPHPRTYHVQVKHEVTEEEIDQLRKGVRIRISGDQYYLTPPCKVEFAAPSPYPSPRNIHENMKTTWLNMTLTEGKFRQVRKMVAAIRHPCIRLIRTSIEDLHLGNLAPGEIRELEEEEFFRKLKLMSNDC